MNRKARRSAGPRKERVVWRGVPVQGPQICFRETYDGTLFIASALGRASVGPHYVRNAMKRVRKQRNAA